MSYEINIIAINQKSPVHLEKVNRVLLHNEIENYEVNRYEGIWPFFSHVEGILYSLVEELCEEFYSAFELCDSDFNECVPQKVIYGDEILTKNHLTPFIIKNEVYTEIINILYYVLKHAPQKRILFHTRYRGGDEEIVIGVIKMSKFEEMLLHRQIQFNICYILQED